MRSAGRQAALRPMSARRAGSRSIARPDDDRLRAPCEPRLRRAATACSIRAPKEHPRRRSRASAHSEVKPSASVASPRRRSVGSRRTPGGGAGIPSALAHLTRAAATKPCGRAPACVPQAGKPRSDRCLREERGRAASRDPTMTVCAHLASRGCAALRRPAPYERRRNTRAADPARPRTARICPVGRLEAFESESRTLIGGRRRLAATRD